MLLVLCCGFIFFFKQKTAYEMRISDWSSDVCSSDLVLDGGRAELRHQRADCRPGFILAHLRGEEAFDDGKLRLLRRRQLIAAALFEHLDRFATLLGQDRKRVV